MGDTSTVDHHMMYKPLKIINYSITFAAIDLRILIIIDTILNMIIKFFEAGYYISLSFFILLLFFLFFFLNMIPFLQY